jgi:hypothetical protein
MIDILIEKGVITRAEIDAEIARVRPRWTGA